MDSSARNSVGQQPGQKGRQECWLAMVVGAGGRPAALGLWSPGWGGGLWGCSMQAGELSAPFLQWWTEALAPGSQPSTPFTTGVLASRPAGDFLLLQSLLP